MDEGAKVLLFTGVGAVLVAGVLWLGRLLLGSPTADPTSSPPPSSVGDELYGQDPSNLP